MRLRDNPWAAKLRLSGVLSDEDTEVLDRLIAEPEILAADTDMVREGQRMELAAVVLDGMLCRYHMLENGRRQITAFLLPGDMCDLHGSLLREMDHSIGVLTVSRVVRLPRHLLNDAMERQPALARAFWWSVLVDEAILRQWIVNVGRRTAYARTAHLMCELFERMSAVGHTSGQSFRFPLTQQELADTLGMSIVHTNRTLQRLRSDRVLTFDNGFLTVRDLDKLQAIAGFNPHYLHHASPAAAARRR